MRVSIISTIIKIILTDDHTTCNVESPLVDADVLITCTVGALLVDGEQYLPSCQNCSDRQ